MSNLMPCPRGLCGHLELRHDWDEPGVEPACCVEGCDCGKDPMNVPQYVPQVSAPTGGRPVSPTQTSEVTHEGP